MQDERESGIRKILNFGHTIGHAIEKQSKYTLKHGYAVSIGMVIAAGISEKLGLIPASDTMRLTTLLEKFGLPVSYPQMSGEVFEVMKNDKKRGGDHISLVLLDEIGNAILKDVTLGELKNWIYDLC